MQSTMLLCAAWLAAVACPVAGLSAAVTTKVTEVAAAQVFARLADRKLLLDVPGAATPEMKDCCHGGCDNCDYSRIFDEMNAGKAKWVSCYLTQEHSDGRRHEAPIAGIFGEDASWSASPPSTRGPAWAPRSRTRRATSTPRAPRPSSTRSPAARRRSAGTSGRRP